jgi:hypothetical protein
MFAKKGDWVQIQRVVLKAGDRAPQVPEDTARLPLEMRVKGFLLADAKLGDDVTIETMIGRQVSGQMTAIAPGYLHDFGDLVPELLQIQRQLKTMIWQDLRHG